MYNTTPVEVFEFHRSMLDDKVRTDSFLSALLQTVKPGDVVLDIGSGTGVLACFACQAGAKHVYAIEQGPIIGLAREICARNNLQEQVTFINDWSANIKLPERADILVTETVGNIGFEEGILHWVLDAKKRFLREGARIIPRTMEMFAVPVESKDDYEMVDSWAHYFYNFNFSPLQTLAASNLLWIDLTPEMFLSEPASMVLAELARVDASDLQGQASFIVKRKGSVHGFGGWFAAELAPGINLSNVPPNRTPSWSHTFLALEWPVEVSAGDRLDLTIHTSRNGVRWQWQVTHYPAAADGQFESGDMLPQQTTQTGELSAFTATEDLTLVPTRNSKGDIDLFILEQINGKLTVAEIARQAEKQFPKKFSYTSLLERIYKLMSLYAGGE
jgi:protein arginine N-methyltransferase 1